MTNPIYQWSSQKVLSYLTGLNPINQQLTGKGIVEKYQQVTTLNLRGQDRFVALDWSDFLYDSWHDYSR